MTIIKQEVTMRLRNYMIEVIPKFLSYELARKGIKKKTKPFSLTYSVTPACRSLCKNCNIGRVYLANPDIIKQNLSIEEIEKTFKSLGHIHDFHISGGEPFMRLDLPEIMQLAFIHLKPKFVSISTNSLTPKSIETATIKILKYMDQYLPPYVPLSMIITLNGIGKMHDYISGVKGSVRKLDETVRRLVSLQMENPRLNIDMKSIVSNYNIYHMEALDEMIYERDLGSYLHELAEQRMDFHNIGDPITPSAEVYFQLSKRFIDDLFQNIYDKTSCKKLSESIRLEYYRIVYQILKEKRQITHCYGGLSNIHLNYNGNVWPCNVLGDSQLMGNVRKWDYNVKALLRSKKAKSVIKYIADGNCACTMADQWLNNIILTPKHMKNVLHSYFYEFKSVEKRTTPLYIGDLETKAIVNSKAGMINDPTLFTKDDLCVRQKESTAATPLRSSKPFHVISIKSLGPRDFILRLERNGMEFIPGQYFVLGEINSLHAKEYTVYSSLQDDYLEFLITTVYKGNVSPLLRRFKTGDILEVEGPLGSFVLDHSDDKNIKHVFIANGIGIAPFHSIVTSNPGLNYQIIHGVRYRDYTYDLQDYDPKRYTICTSRERTGDFVGWVTHYLNKNPVNPNNMFYLCGKSEMMYDVYNILISQGVKKESIKAEMFY